MSRIETRFQSLAQHGRKALIPFITAGDPAPSATVGLMHALVDAGSDIVELGIPFSDPMADGPVIQRASERALKHGVGLTDVLEMVREFRQKDQTTPVVLMGYINPLVAMGYETFAAEAARAGVDGMLTVDCPPEESAELAGALERHGIDPIFLLAPTTPEHRIQSFARYARGYVYYVSLRGVTGAAHLDMGEIEARLPLLRRYIDLPIGVGFGIRDGKTARQVAEVADAVVIGSRIVQEIEASTADTLNQNVGRLISEIRAALDA